MFVALTMLVFLQPQSAEFTDLNIEGWTVHVQKAIMATRPKLWEAAKNELTCQLMRIERVVPDEPLKKIKTIPFWIHLKDPNVIGAAYHPDAGWLRAHKMDPAMARGIEVGNLANFVSWSYQQPWMLMHELSHGYHDQFVKDGWKNAEVLSAFNEAVASHKYDDALLYNGTKHKAYAMTNEMEYFAETTESYFGVNDFFPFIRAELQILDPTGYAMMRKMWGDPAEKVPSG